MRGLTGHVRQVERECLGQLNVENLAGARYYVFAHNNNNITPGAPRSAYVTVNARSSWRRFLRLADGRDADFRAKRAGFEKSIT